MGMKQMKCCCDVGCTIALDDYNRADANPPSGSWNEVSGEWAIAGNILTNITEGVLTTTHRQGKPRGSTYNYIVFVDLITTDVTEWGVIAKYTDASNFDWVEFYVDGALILPRFYRRAGGSDTLVMDITTHPAGIAVGTYDGMTAVRVKVCYSEVGWTVEGDSEMTRWTTCDANPATTLPASPNGLVGMFKGDFDNWRYDYHYLSNEPCPICECYCQSPDTESDRRCMPEELVLTIRPIAPFTDPYGGCAPGGDVVLNMYQSLPSGVSPTVTPTYDPSPQKREWYSDVIEFPDRGIEMWFLLVCIDNTFRLHQLLYPGDFPANGSGSGVVEWVGTPFGTYQIPDVVTCSPLYLHFEVLRVTNHDDGVSIPYCDTLPDLDYELIISE